MIPFSSVLRKMKANYIFDNVKTNNLLSMGKLKIFSKNEKGINRLVLTVQAISKDIGMEFGIQKCGKLVLKRG